MRTVVLGQRPAELEELLERRRALGQDTHDEVWEGELHVAPPGPHVFHAIVDAELQAVLRPYAKAAGLVGGSAFNLGEGPDDFRVPDGAYFREQPRGSFVPTAAAVVEVLSPDDETFNKVAFYAERGVAELLVAHPEERWVRCFDLQQGGAEVQESRVLGARMADVELAIAWPE